MSATVVFEVELRSVLANGSTVSNQSQLAIGGTTIAERDNEDELVELTGTVIEWRFVNPHPSLVLEVIAADGNRQEWDVSYGGAAVTHLRRRGYTADTFEPGDVITVRGFAALVESAYGLLVRGDPTTEDGAAIVPVR